MNPPILYTFRRCPYAIRSRMALAHSGITYELREVVLRNKPQAMIDKSAKATVPVLVLDAGTTEERVIDESLDIMHWCLDLSDPQGWRAFAASDLERMATWVERIEAEFKPWLDRYKYAVRYPEATVEDYRSACANFLAEAEALLTKNNGDYLFGPRLSYADVALFPFVRQFANVDPSWFATSHFTRVSAWLDQRLQQPEFVDVMKKYAPWEPGQAPLYYTADG